jgi:hypothetical protein
MTATTKTAKAASAATTASRAPVARIAGREPVKFVKRIGSTNYSVSVRFNATATETAEDKILRLIEREVGSLC